MVPLGRGEAASAAVAGNRGGNEGETRSRPGLSWGAGWGLPGDVGWRRSLLKLFDFPGKSYPRDPTPPLCFHGNGGAAPPACVSMEIPTLPLVARFEPPTPACLWVSPSWVVALPDSLSLARLLVLDPLLFIPSLLLKPPLLVCLLVPDKLSLRLALPPLGRAAWCGASGGAYLLLF